jgi:hypothetical protein
MLSRSRTDIDAEPHTRSSAAFAGASFSASANASGEAASDEMGTRMMTWFSAMTPPCFRIKAFETGTKARHEMIDQVWRREIRAELLAIFSRNQCRVHTGNGVVRPSSRKRLKEFKKVAWLSPDEAKAGSQGARPAQLLLAKSGKKLVERWDRVRRSLQPDDIGR